MAAVGIGLLANSISGDNVGLGAEPLSAGETLAPASATKADDRSQKRTRTRRRNRNRGGDDGQADTRDGPALERHRRHRHHLRRPRRHLRRQRERRRRHLGLLRLKRIRQLRLRLDPGRLRLGRLERLRQLWRLRRLEPTPAARTTTSSAGSDDRASPGRRQSGAGPKCARLIRLAIRRGEEFSASSDHRCRPGCSPHRGVVRFRHHRRHGRRDRPSERRRPRRRRWRIPTAPGSTAPAR